MLTDFTARPLQDVVAAENFMDSSDAPDIV